MIAGAIRGSSPSREAGRKKIATTRIRILSEDAVLISDGEVDRSDGKLHVTVRAPVSNDKNGLKDAQNCLLGRWHG
jgi:hypothetical protein